MRRSTILALTGVVLLLSGCTPPTKTPPYDPGQAQIAKAQNLLDAGDYDGAANLYRRLAQEVPSPARENYQIAAADALLKAGKDMDARQYAQTIRTTGLTPRQRNRLYLLYSQIELSSANAEQSLKYLQNVSPRALATDDRIKYHQQRAFALSLTGNFIESARNRVALHTLLKDPQQQAENNSAILKTLGEIPVDTLTQQQPAPPDVLGGWMALARILKQTPPGSPGQERQLAWWRQAFPSHPADSAFLKTHVHKPVHRPGTARSIAVILPHAGPFAGAAKAIEEGFVSAYYAQRSGEIKPVIRFYDSTASNVYSVYQKAVSENADFIVGPLQKHEVESLANGGELNIPVLALNTIPGLNRSNLYQFGLNPLDEAEQVAQNAWAAGYRDARLMIPRTELGQRIGNHFRDYWRDLGGDILKIQAYDPKQVDFSLSVRELLDVNRNHQRVRPTERVSNAGPLEFPEVGNGEFVFLVAYPSAGRLIRPQIRFFQTYPLPVFATSHIYSGRPSPSEDHDLDAIFFCDIPWLLEGFYGDPLSRRHLQGTWAAYPDAYLRLAALGIDAYRLIHQLGQLHRIPYRGVTGDLSLDDRNQIRRHLQCARFDRGIPQLVRAAPRQSDTFTIHSPNHAETYRYERH